MPRSQIDLPHRVDHLSILDENGHLDRELEPEMPEGLLLKIHRHMVLARRFDERMVELQRQGRIATFPPIQGHEAAHLGAVATLRETDWMVPSFREAGAEIWRGRSLESFLLYYAGYDEGGCVEEGRNDLPIAVPVGSQTLHAVGLAQAIKYTGSDQVVLCFFGDGATSEGDFHEAMNFAGVFQTPVVFVCQNNQWAISLPRSRQTASKTLAQKALAYGVPGIQVDGNDVLAVYASTKEAVDRARSGGGPSMVECVTYRVVMHTTADDPKRYRSEEEAQEWVRRDPLPRFQSYLKGKGLLTEEAIQAVEEDVRSEIQSAVWRAENRMKQPPDPLHMFEHAYAEMPPSLIEQREELRREVAARGGAGEVAGGDAVDVIKRLFEERRPVPGGAGEDNRG
ncbi:MAG: pyruvate dehydrogenase (acetyl-transferring) E1 component subunit alpha [Sphingomonadaceae bacterium]